MKTQHTPEESSNEVKKECVWSTLLCESDQPNSTLQIHFMLTLRLEYIRPNSNGPMPVRPIYSNGFSALGLDYWPVPDISSTDS